jgi:hypothetical protein
VPGFRHAVDDRRLDHAAEAAQLSAADVVQDDEQDGAGQAGLDSSTVRPMTPGNSLPAAYSTGSLMTQRASQSGKGARITPPEEAGTVVAVWLGT